MKIGLTFNCRGLDSHTRVEAAGLLDLPADDDQEEFDSPETVAAIAETLTNLGHEVELLGSGRSLLERLLTGSRPDLVWNFAEGDCRTRSREAHVPAMLEMLGIPFTGSDPLTLAATLDKDCAKRLVSTADVPTPAWVLYDGSETSLTRQVAELGYPVFVKPAFEGSSKGVVSNCLIREAGNLLPAVRQLHAAYGQPVLIEQYIEGDELTVGLVGNTTPKVLGIMRILPREATSQPFIYSLEVKRDWQRRARYECPALLSENDQQAVRDAALAAWQVLGCRDVARFDFRLRDGVPYFLEVNPLPGLSPISGDLVILARHVGIEHQELIARILAAAQARLGLSGAELACGNTACCAGR